MSVNTRLDSVNTFAAFQSAPDPPCDSGKTHPWIHARIVLHCVAGSQFPHPSRDPEAPHDGPLPITQWHQVEH
jgi:hypothetical protein